jgi:hypothetical protein
MAFASHGSSFRNKLEKDEHITANLESSGRIAIDITYMYQ